MITTPAEKNNESPKLNISGQAQVQTVPAFICVRIVNILYRNGYGIGRIDDVE